jgi:Leucine-rich repeat (LRR) protein
MKTCDFTGLEPMQKPMHASVLIEREGGTVSLGLQTSLDCTLEGADSCSWLSFSFNRSKAGLMELRMAASANPVAHSARFACCHICIGESRLPLYVTQAADDRKVLLKLRASLMARHKDGLNMNIRKELGWLHKKDMDNWNGVKFTKKTFLKKLYVNAIDLDGPFPKEILHLPHLETLHLSCNSLCGTIPKEIVYLPRLRDLNLSYNRLSGEMPKEIALLPSLESLNLYGNEFSGPIPEEFGLLSSLKYLYLDKNVFSGSIPKELGQMSALKVLELSGNKLSGAIPPELGQLSALQNLDLSRNRLTGQIPAELGNLHSLEALCLNCNYLEGAVPENVQSLAPGCRLSVDRQCRSICQYLA